MNAFTWLDSQSYVERAAWFGSFEITQPPDYYATGLNALFNAHGTLSDMGFWYGYTSRPDKRSLRRGRHVLARNGTGAGDDDAVHCDDTCHRRNSQIEAYEATLLPGPPADS